MLPNFLTGSGMPDYTASMIEASLGICVYYNFRADAQRIVEAAGGGEIIIMDYHILEDPPSWMTWHQGDTYNVVFSGVQSATQLIKFAVRTADTYYPGTRKLINTFVYRNWESIKLQVRRSLPANIDRINLKFAGHSRGGAMAQLASLDYLGQIGQERLEVMSIDSPKGFENNFPGPIPSKMVHFAIDLSPVAYAPGYDQLVQLLLGNDIFLGGRQLQWEQLPNNWSLTDKGELNYREPQYFNQISIENLPFVRPENHFLALILEKIIKGWKANVGQGIGLAVLPIAEELISRVLPDKAWPSGPPETLLNIDDLNASIFASQTTPPVTTTNTLNLVSVFGSIDSVSRVVSGSISTFQGVGDMAGRATWFFYDPGFSAGWSESLSNEISDLETLLAMAKTYAVARFPLLGFNQLIRYIRVSKDDVRGDSRVEYPGQKYKNTVEEIVEQKANNKPDTPWQTINLRFSGGGDNYRKFLFFRGVPDRIEVNPPGPVVFDDAAYTAAFNNWKRLVLRQGWGWKANVRTLVNQQQVTALTVSTPIVGNLTITTAAAHLLAIGDRVRFIDGNIKPKINASPSVLGVPSATQFVIKNGALAFDITALPKVGKVSQVLVRADDIQIATESSRKTGRPFAQRPGRLRAVVKRA